jgi:hypothetical protein
MSWHEQQSIKGAEVSHRAVLPEYAVTRACAIERLANGLALVVDGVHDAVRIGHSRKLAQIFGLSKTIATLLRADRHLDHQPVSCHLPPRTV